MRKTKFYAATLAAVMTLSAAGCSKTAVTEETTAVSAEVETTDVETTEAETTETETTEAETTEAETTELETETEAHVHDYAEATCTDPATCTICGATEGEALGHDFTPATVEAPKTCTRCGITEGNPVSFHELSVPEGYDSLCVRSDAFVGIISRIDSTGPFNVDTLEIYFMTLDGEVKGSTEVSSEWPLFDTWYVTENAVIVCHTDSETQATGGGGVSSIPTTKLFVYDFDGKCHIEAEVDFTDAFGSMDSTDYGNVYPVASSDENGIVKVYNNNSEAALLYFDQENFEQVDTSVYTEDDSYTHEGWYYYREQANGLIMVGSLDQSEWGYLDADGNVLAMYADASDFTSSGYALVSNDREHYDLIDNELNVVAENIVSGVSVSVYDDVITVKAADGSKSYYMVE